MRCIIAHADRDIDAGSGLLESIGSAVSGKVPFERLSAHGETCDADAGSGSNAVTGGGCGCRLGTHGSAAGKELSLLLLLGLVSLRRRRQHVERR